MLIFEVENAGGVDTGKLMALSQFLAGRANDTNAKKEISTTAFIQRANSMGVNVTPDTIGDLIAKEPLSNLLQPFDPNSNVIRFKGNDEPTNTQMDTNQAQKVVDQNAKAAMKRGMSK
jgi:hypothetical protein